MVTNRKIKRYITLWIPVECGKTLNPLNYIKNPNDDFIKIRGGSRIYSQNEKRILDVNEEITITNILFSDKEPQKVFLSLTLCKSEENADGLSIPKRSIRVNVFYNDMISGEQIIIEKILMKL